VRRLKKTCVLIRCYRLFRLALIVLCGLLLSLCLTPAARHRLKSSWSIALLDALGVVVEADLAHRVPGCLLVANHVSWIDIYVINGVIPAAFVAKADIRTWPVLGWLAARNGTIFLRRGSRGHARIINQQVGEVLAAGRHVAVFPEGTTTDGRQLLHFHAALLEPAVASGRPILPLALSYWESDGQRSLAPRYDGEISLGQSLWAILGRKKLIARLTSTPLLGGQGESRKWLAAQARVAIASAAGLPLMNSRPEIPAYPQGTDPTQGVV
jgi:1-acyl-sn-glycerol-3-phosphate acyltransferase